MKLSYSFCLALVMSTMPIHASLAADTGGNDETQISNSVESAPASDINLDNDTVDFNGPGRPGGPGGPGQGGPGGFHPGPGPGGFHPGPVGPAPGPGGFHPGPGGPGPGGFHPGPVGPGGFGPGPGRVWNFPRPVYNWNWNAVRVVTCVAEDQYGRQYPVTESAYAGPAYEAEMSNIEDQALNTCYQDSGDESCSLLECTPGY
jgi:hypothetical protein